MFSSLAELVKAKCWLRFVDKQAFLAKQNNDMFESCHWNFSRGHNPWFWSEKDILKPRKYTQIHTPPWYKGG